MLKPIILKNKLTVLRYPRSGTETFSVSFVTKTGTAVELSTDYPQGISFLIERLFWAGTDKHPNQRNLYSTLEGMGGQFTSSTTHELMEFGITVPSYNQFKAVSFLAEIIQRSAFDERDIEEQKNKILTHLRESDQSFQSEITEASLAALYPGSSLARPLEGSVDTVLQISVEDILHYISQCIHPETSYVIISGNFDNRPVMELVEQEWTFWTPKTRGYSDPHSLEHTQTQDLPQFAIVQRGSQYTRVSLSFVGIGGMRPVLNDEGESIETERAMYARMAEVLLLNTVLGGGYSSRLWSKSVTEEGFFDHIRSDIIRFHSVGHIQIAGSITNAQFTFGLESVLSVLESVRKTTISINELTKAKELLKGTFILQHEDVLSSSIWHAENFIGATVDIQLSQLIEAIDKVTAPQIRARASDIFTPSNLSIVSLGTTKETNLIEKLLRKYLES